MDEKENEIDTVRDAVKLVARKIGKVEFAKAVTRIIVSILSFGSSFLVRLFASRKEGFVLDRDNEDFLVGIAAICMIGKIVTFSLKATALAFIVIAIMKLFGSI